MSVAELLADLGGVVSRYADVTPETFIPSLRSMIDELAALDEAYTGPATLEAGAYGGVRCLIAKPPQAGADVVMYIHGGGYAAGSPETHANLIAALAERSGCVVVAPDYPLTPENNAEGIIGAIRGVYDAIVAEFSGRIFVAGDSAGGALTLTHALALKASGGRSPDALVVLSPVTDLTQSGGSIQSKADVDPMLQPALLGPLYSMFLGEKPADDPILSPLHGDLAGLPPIFMQVGGKEILLDDSIMFAERAKAAGVKVDCAVWPDMFHVWQIFPVRLAEARAALDDIANFLKSV